jgi:hypothetical protein
MTRLCAIGLAAMLAAATTAAAPQNKASDLQTWTGWFSDKRCARPPGPDDSVRPNGTACVKKCLNGGAAPVFVSEQANALYDVQNHASVADDVGYRVEVTGVVDEKAKTISVRSVKRLSEVTALCLLPRKRAK